MKYKTKMKMKAKGTMMESSFDITDEVIGATSCPNRRQMIIKTICT
jgi:hypothetical protein